MTVFLFMLSGMVAGLIVASWHGFKGSPWEGFMLARFPRSIVWGRVRGIFRDRRVFFISYGLGTRLIFVFLFVPIYFW